MFKKAISIQPQNPQQDGSAEEHSQLSYLTRTLSTLSREVRQLHVRSMKKCKVIQEMDEPELTMKWANLRLKPRCERRLLPAFGTLFQPSKEQQINLRMFLKIFQNKGYAINRALQAESRWMAQDGQSLLNTIIETY